MAQIKLSKAQKEVISTLKENGVIYYTDGIDARCFYSKGVNKKISWATIFKLEDYNLVKRINDKVELTENGLNYFI